MNNFFNDLEPPKKPKAEKFDGQFEAVIPFDQHITPEIPADLLPDGLAAYVQNISDVLSVPTAMPFMAALGMVSAGCCKKFIVMPKPDWIEPVNIYSLTAMLPASNKSQTLKYLKSPIDEWEEKEAKRIKPEREEALTEIKLLQAELNKQYNIIKAKKSKAAEIKDAKNAVKEIEEKLQAKKDVLPAIPQIYTTDATPEAIAELVHDQGGRLGIISDEGGITEVLSGLYNNGNANIDIILKGIDGGAARIKRANRDYKLNPFLTIILLIQPQVLANMADKKAFTGNGALERYLYALPVGNVGYRTFSDARIDQQDKIRYDNLIYNLLSIPMPEKPYILTLENPAQKMLHDFRLEIERELRADGKLYICRGWGGKLAGYTARIAGLMHVAQYGRTDHLIIQRGTMEKAITLARLLMEHAVAAYNMMGADIEVSDAKELLEWLKTQRKSRLTKSQIINAMRNRQAGKKERLKKALALLEERNILSAVHVDNSTRKPTDVYFVNAEIYS